MVPHNSDPTRERLLNAAGEIFAEKGFKAATVREICTRVGANIAAVNYYFRDKQGLYVEAVKAAHCASMQHLSPWPPGISSSRKLWIWVREMLTQLLDPARPAWHSQLMMRELADPTEACAALVEAYIRPSALTLEAILAEPLTARLGHSPDRATLYLFGFSVVSQCLFYKVQRPIAELLVGSEAYATYSVDRLTDHITRFSLRAMGLPEDVDDPQTLSQPEEIRSREFALPAATTGAALPPLIPFATTVDQPPRESAP